LRLLHENKYCRYYRLEIASEVDKIDIPEEDEGFDFFHGLGIVGYDKAFKMWLRKFPRPILIVALRDRKVIGWTFIEDWGQSSTEGLPVYVLRAIEVLPEERRKKIGRTLVTLAILETTGYLITKPLTPEAERFFKSIGFMSREEFTKPPIDLTKSPNYLIFPIYKRDVAIRDFEIKN
jgi:GNAT superfamily N-acetyltransferase